MASHDLRNPLSTLRGFLDLLAEDADLNENGAHLLGRAIQVTDRMGALIDAIGAYGYARRRPLASAPIDTSEAARAACDELAALIDEHDATVEVDDLPSVLGDRDAVTEVLRHVLDNAIRYHLPDGGATASVTGGADGDRAILHIEDRGPGLPEGTEETVFEPFTKTVNSRGHQTWGLGLANARTLVERMGGTIHARASQPGTRVTIELPTG